MKNISLWCCGLGAVTVSSVLISAGLAQDTVEAAFEPTPAMLTYMTPGAGHEALQPLAGAWDLTLKWRMTPDAAWEESAATSERVWIMDGRFLQEKVDSEWMGQPFEGRGLLGFDTLSEEYTSIWFDSMGTGMMVGTGPVIDGDALTLEGTHTDPMKNDTEAWFRSVISIHGPDHHVWESYHKDDAGNEYKDMEIAYKRR